MWFMGDVTTNVAMHQTANAITATVPGWIPAFFANTLESVGQHMEQDCGSGPFSAGFGSCKSEFLNADQDPTGTHHE